MARIIQDDVADVIFPMVLRYTLGLSNIATEFVLPENMIKLSLKFETNEGLFAFTGTDQDTISANRGSSAAGLWTEISFSTSGSGQSSRDSIFLASATSSTVVQMLFEG